MNRYVIPPSKPTYPPSTLRHEPIAVLPLTEREAWAYDSRSKWDRQRPRIAPGRWAKLRTPPTRRPFRFDPDAISMTPIPGWRVGDPKPRCSHWKTCRHAVCRKLR